jgi:cyclic beta-1,2-glucan synthetase
MQNDIPFAEKCEIEAQKLKINIHENAWDGKWYRRAYFDDGTPLGSEKNTECQIDSLSQSWAILSGAGDPARSLQALKEADDRLVLNDEKIIRLLDPAFDITSLDPGYIKGYVPGVRENGGQYTHAAVWMIMAYAKLGNAKRAWELLHMINPINHTSNQEGVSVYKVEPYVVAADVYALDPHTGRGGWTWYSGSAGWMYQLITNSLLGIRLSGNKLSFEPCIPQEWNSFKITYKYLSATYHIQVIKKTDAVKTNVIIDGIEQTDPCIHLQDDGKEHQVEIAFSKVLVAESNLRS